MPIYDNTYSFSCNTGTSMGTDFYVTIPYYAQQQYERYRQMCEQQERRWEQAYEEEMLRLEEEKRLAEELRDDRRKYPLFFLKAGIV